MSDRPESIRALHPASNGGSAKMSSADLGCYDDEYTLGGDLHYMHWVQEWLADNGETEVERFAKAMYACGVRDGLKYGPVVLKWDIPPHLIKDFIKDCALLSPALDGDGVAASPQADLGEGRK